MRILLILLCCFPMLVTAQSPVPEKEWFDFWVGDWELTWQDADGSQATGKNLITREMNGHVIQENFEVLSGSSKGFVGMSVSVYHAGKGKWYQTWVDNQGAYLDFWGEYDGGKRMFVRKATSPQGKEIMQRMVFYNIDKDSFTWDWENSQDGGKSWNLSWRINYKRRV